MATEAPRRSGRVSRLRPPSAVFSSRLHPLEQTSSPRQSPSRLPLPTRSLTFRQSPGISLTSRLETTFTVDMGEKADLKMSEELEDDGSIPGEIDPSLSMVPGVELAEKQAKEDEDTEEGRAGVGETPGNTTFSLPSEVEQKPPDVTGVGFSVTPDVVPANFDVIAHEPDELPPGSPGQSSLGASLKFLEASHLWSFDEMVNMGYIHQNENAANLEHPPVNVDASATSSLLTESLLNVSVDNWKNMKSPAVASSSRSHEAQNADLAKKIGEEPNVEQSGESEVAELRNSTFSEASVSEDTGYQGGDSETVSSSLDGKESTKHVEHPGTEIPNMEGFPEVARMEAVEEELADRSVSEADLTMREDETEAVVTAPSLVSLTSIASASNKKRTRSPTPSSAKTESVPAKRSLTQQKPMTVTSRLSNPTTGRRPGVATKSVSSHSVAERSSHAANQRSTAPVRKSASSSSGSTVSLSRQSNNVPSTSARRPSATSSKPGTGPSASTASPRTTTASSRPRRSIAGSLGNVAETKKDARDGGSVSTLRRSSAATAGNLPARGSISKTNKPAIVASSSNDNSNSRLKAPTAFNRTFSKRSSTASSSADTAPTPRQVGLRSTVSGSTVSVTSTAPTPKRRDSQLVRQPSLPKSAKGPSASSTPFADRTASSTAPGSTTPTIGKTRPAAITTTSKAETHRNSPTVLKIDAEQQTPPSPPHTPIQDLRDRLTAETEQSNSQRALLTSQTEQLASQSQQLSSQSQQLAARAGRISELTEELQARDVAICETRCQLREAVYSFDIMAIVCQNLDEQCSTAERNVGMITEDRDLAIESLNEMRIQLNTAVSEKAAIEEELIAKDQQHEDELQNVEIQHMALVKTEKQKMKDQMENALERMVDQHSAEVKTLKRYREKELERLRVHYETMLQDLKRKHTLDLEEISQRDERHLQELQHQHEKKVSEMTHRFEEMKVALTERVQSLHAEGNDLKSKASHHQDQLRRSSDVKLQAVIQQFQHLPEENASLKAVLDLKINENAELRRQNTELQEKVAKLEEVRDKMDQLLREKENLQAIISLKTDNEKQLQDKHHQLLRRYDRESKEKKRLSMNYEELLYKLEERQSAEDLTKSSLTDFTHGVDVFRTSMSSSAVIVRPRMEGAGRPRHRGLQHDRSKRRTIASNRDFDS